MQEAFLAVSNIWLRTELRVILLDLNPVQCRDRPHKDRGDIKRKECEDRKYVKET